MEVTKQLQPIYYDSDLLLDLLEEIERYSTVEKFEGRAEWDGRDTRFQFDDAYNLIDENTIPNRILAFEVHLRADEGHIRLTVDATKGNEFHRLIIRGDEEWVKKNLQNISDFERSHTERLRSILSNAHLTGLQYLLTGSALILAIPYMITLHPSFHFPIPREVLLLGGVHLLLIALLEVPKRIYPYVVFTRNGTEPIHRAIISVLIPLLSVISVALSAIGVLL